MFGTHLLDSNTSSVTSLSGVPTGLTPGSVVFIGPTTALAEDNANLFWDDTNDRLGILTNTPTSTVSVGSTSQFRIGSDGDLDRIKDVPYSWPAANSLGSLNNDGAGNLSWAAPSPAAHNLLSASHGDTAANAVTRGSLIYGNTTPAWDELVIGGANTILGSDGTDVAWRAQSFIDHGALTGLADDDHTQYLRLAGRAGGQLAQGGTATGDNLDLDPSSAANYTGGIRLNTTATDYGSGSITGVTLWPNGFTHGAGAGAVLSGVRWPSTATIDADELAVLNMFSAVPTVTNTAGVTTFPFSVWFEAASNYNNAQAVAATLLLWRGFQSAPTFSITGGGTWAVTEVSSFYSEPPTIPASVTVSDLRHYVSVDAPVVGTLTTQTGFLTSVNSGTTPLSLRSTGVLAQMRHAGSAIFGADAAPAATLSVGSGSLLRVAGADGDLERIKNVPYDWPAANAAGALNNDGAGNLSWATPAGSIIVQEGDVTVDAAATTLDFTEPDAVLVTSAPAGEANVNMALYALLSGRSGGQNLNGGTAVTDHLDLDPSSAANFTTGAVRIAPGAGDYGTGGALGIDLWPNGLTHGNGAAATRISGVRMTSTLTFDASAATLPIFQFFRDSHVCVNSDVGVTAMPVNQSFISNPTLRNAFSDLTSGPNYVGYSAGPTWSITGGGTIEATAVCFRSNPATIPAGVAFNAGFTHFIATDMTVSGTIGAEHVGYDCTVASGTTPVSYRSTAAAAQMRHAGPAAFGVNAAPATTVDILGDLATRVESRALVNGANNDVDAADISFLRITGPTLAFSVSGFTDGQDGKYLVVRNTTALAMTIVNNATSTAANQILTQTGANVVMTGTGSAWFIYDSTSARWILLAVRHSLGEGV